MMNFFSTIKNAVKLNSLRREEAIKTCIENEIPLTEANIMHMMEQLKFQNKRAHLT
jgi:hypothetical protein